METQKRRAIFLDRDGVINHPPTSGLYITSPADLQLIDGVPEAIRSFREAGFLVIVVTNQSGIARGVLMQDTLDAIHARLRDLLQSAGADVDDILYCPHDDLDGCPCRKPKPGMLLRAAERHGVDLALSWMVGDTVRDIEAGQGAGCTTVLVYSHPLTETCPADYQLCSLTELQQLMVNSEHRYA